MMMYERSDWTTLLLADEKPPGHTLLQVDADYNVMGLQNYHWHSLASAKIEEGILTSKPVRLICHCLT